MLDFIGTIVLVAAIIFSINALTGAMPISTSQRLALSVGAGLWSGLAAGASGVTKRVRRREPRCSECRCLS